MSVSVPLLGRDKIARLPERAREVIEYRESGLSLNHIQGCPLDCAYCIRHAYGLWDARVPKALMSDAAAFEELVGHRYFQYRDEIAAYHKPPEQIAALICERLTALLTMRRM